MCIEENVPVRHTIRLLRNSDESGLLEHEINVESTGREGQKSIVSRRL